MIAEAPELILPGQKPFHILEAQQFSREWMERELFPTAGGMEHHADSRKRQSLKGRRVKILFYEPSTRTSDSFESAIKLLGGDVSVTSNARAFSSAVKGETLEDTIEILNGYRYDCIILRYHEEGGAKRAARVSKVPIINAGDGKGQHPTQALLDVYTIQEALGHLGGQRVAMIGDLDKGRTVHSLAYLLAKFPNMHFDFVSPPSLRIPQGIRDYLNEKGVSFTEDRPLKEVLPEIDVAYMTREQLERANRNVFSRILHSKIVHNSLNAVNLQSISSSSQFRDLKLDLEALDLMQSHAIAMHPLPRNAELPPEIDSDPKVIFKRQAENGLFIRMALSEMILTGKRNSNGILNSH